MRALFLALLLLAAPSLGQASRLFNGTDDTITMGDVLDFQRTDPFSIACHYKMAATGPTLAHSLITKMQSGGDQLGWALDVAGEVANDPLRWRLAAGASDRIYVTFPRSDDTIWHHAGCGYDGSQDVSGLSCYVDGVSQTLTTVQNDLDAGSSLTSQALRIGAAATGVRFFGGNIAYCSVHNVKLRADEFATMRFRPFDVARGRVGFWPLMENAADATYQDYSGANLDGTAANDPDVSSDGPAVFIPGGGN